MKELLPEVVIIHPTNTPLILGEFLKKTVKIAAFLAYQSLKLKTGKTRQKSTPTLQTTLKSEITLLKTSAH